MDFEIIERPFRVTVFGFGGAIGSDGAGAAGKRHMDRLWREVRDHGIATKGINHWIYLPDSRIFTGVELAPPAAEHGALEEMTVTIDRYLRYVHRGEYSTLPEVWQMLIDELKKLNEVPKCPSIEVYGHWNADPSKCETTILIGLNQSPIL
ncbi:MAG: hypothetical protein U0795_14960 [Pirellulales bacterium]